MKTVQLSDLGPLAEDVRNGETLEVLDGDTPVAQVIPMPASPLSREQKAKLVEEFLARPRPNIPGVLEELLRQRREGP